MKSSNEIKSSSMPSNQFSLDDFIETPLQEFEKLKNDIGLKEGIETISKILQEKDGPTEIMNKITNHLYLTSNNIFTDLVDKFKHLNCFDKLAGLLDEKAGRLEKLVDACIYNQHDLSRCITSLPAEYSNKMIAILLKKEDLMKRLFEADNDPSGTLESLQKLCSGHATEFSTKFQELYPQPRMMR